MKKKYRKNNFTCGFEKRVKPKWVQSAYLGVYQNGYFETEWLAR